MRSVLEVIMLILNLYTYMIVGMAIMSWLLAFKVINQHNQFVGMVMDFLYKVTEPLLAPIRRVLPNMGGIDLSPIVLLLAVFFVQSLIRNYAFPAVISAGI